PGSLDIFGTRLSLPLSEALSEALSKSRCLHRVMLPHHTLQAYEKGLGLGARAHPLSASWGQSVLNEEPSPPQVSELAISRQSFRQSFRQRRTITGTENIQTACRGGLRPRTCLVSVPGAR